MARAIHPDDNSIPVASSSSSETTAEDLKKRLTDEYKILQDKIDKIGAFRFTIKGWSVTAVIAATAAASTSKSLVPALAISGGLAVLLICFFSLEVEQVKLSWLFGNRARRLEDMFIQLDRPSSRHTRKRFPVPYTANEIFLANKDIKRKPPRIALWRSAHGYLYAVLLIWAFATLVVPRYAEVSNYVHRWVDRPVPAKIVDRVSTGK